MGFALRVGTKLVRDLSIAQAQDLHKRYKAGGWSAARRANVMPAHPIKNFKKGSAMPGRHFAPALALLGLLGIQASTAFAAPDINYLQNELDGRGRCLGTAGPAVAMIACNEAPTQQWFTTRGDLPGAEKFHTKADGETVCLAVHPGERKNVLAMEACGRADAQQWYVERLSDVPRQLRLTNRATGATRCLEAVQTGLMMTQCGRRQNGHLWHSNYTPTM
jgi:hypothetical protein